MARVVINTRVLTAPITGVQRYAKELLARWNGDTDTIAPRASLNGVAGHAWEQVVLPCQLRGRFLFSPANTGPLEANDQVVTIHDMATFDCPEAFNARFSAWYRFLLPKLAQRARRIIAVSEFVKGRVLAHTSVSPTKITVIPNGVSSSFCPGAISGWENTVATLRLPSASYILVVGSLEPRKNLARLLKAWRHAQGRIPEDLWLVVAGVRENSRVFRGRCFGALPAKTFLAGYVDELLLPSLCAGALAMAYVSTYEGFGLPAVEAMASGTPVVVGNCSSLPEVVGDAGLMVDPLSVDEMAEAICRVARDPALRASLRERGLLRARQFSWEETARRTWSVLQLAASGN